MDKRFTAAILSGLVCPGAGQLYKKERIKGWALVSAAVGILAAIIVKAWAAMLDAALSMPPEEVLRDIFGVAHSIMESGGGFYRLAVWAFLLVWAYGVADALFAAGSAPREDDRKGVDG